MGPCATCTGSCCRQPWAIPVTAEEAQRLGAVEYTDADGWRYVGHLQKRGGACVFLGPDGCSVYERRPEACRQLDAATCGMYEPDPRKQLGLVQLRQQ